MFERLKRVVASKLIHPSDGDGLLRWSEAHMLTSHRLPNGAIAVEGTLLDRPFKAGCAPSSRPYIVGVELMARAELALRDDVSVVVMHRALKRALEKSAEGLYTSSVESVRTTDKPLPEEIAWLSMYRDAGWPGPPPSFWARYCVLTDNLDGAREWLDAESIAMLSQAPADLRPVTPFLMALTRGKIYLRLQMEAPDDGAVSDFALDTLEQLSARAVTLFGR